MANKDEKGGNKRRRLNYVSQRITELKKEMEQLRAEKKQLRSEMGKPSKKPPSGEAA